MANVFYEIEVKRGNVWDFCRREENPEEVYKKLASDMIAKKINKCTYITRITRSNLYNGYEKIYILYNNGVRVTYQIESH